MLKDQYITFKVCLFGQTTKQFLVLKFCRCSNFDGWGMLLNANSYILSIIWIHLADDTDEVMTFTNITKRDGAVI